MAAGNLITLTEDSTGNTLIFSEDNLISMVDVGVNTRITYLRNNQDVANLLVTETSAAIIAQAPKMLPFTDAKTGGTIFFNGQRIKESFPEGTGSLNDIEHAAAAWRRFNFTENPAAIAVAVNF